MDDVDVKNFKRLRESLNTVGFDDAAIDSMLRVLAGLIHLGDVPLAESEVAAKADDDDENKCVEVNEESLENAAYLLGMDTDELCGTLKRKRIQIPGRRSMHEVPRTESQFRQALHSLIKALYKRLFERTVKIINDSFQELTVLQGAPQEDRHHVGILDIYGFERLEKNSFEQLCINLANERLQQYFVENVLVAEQAVYKREGLPWTGLSLPDSRPVVTAIHQVFTTLDSCSQQLVKGIGNVTDEKFCEQAVDIATKDAVQKTVLFKLKLGNKRRSLAGGASMSQKDGFVIKHYAGEVEYTTKGWPDKNNDRLLLECEELICDSTVPFVKSMGEEDTTTSTKVANAGFRSISKKYTTDLELLLKTLGTCTLHYIRCFKPNDKHSPNSFNQKLVLDQVIQCGTIELVKIMHDGYPNRCAFEEITSRFKTLLPESFQRYGMRTFIEALMLAYEVPRDEWALGMSRLFLKAGQLRMLEEMRAEGATPDADKLAVIVSGIVRKRWGRAGHAVRLCMWLPKFLKQIYAEKAKKALSVASLGIARIAPRLEAAKRRVAERRLRARRKLIAAFQVARYLAAAFKTIKAKRRERIQKAFSLYARINKAMVPLANGARDRVERDRQRKAEAAAEAERLRLEEEARLAAEAERIRLEEEAKAEAERQRLEAEAEKIRLEEEAKAEAERQRLEAEAERIRLEEEAKAEAERQRQEEEARIEAEKRRQEEEAREQELAELRAKAAELDTLKAAKAPKLDVESEQLSPSRARGIPTPTRSPTRMRSVLDPVGLEAEAVAETEEEESDIGDSVSRVQPSTAVSSDAESIQAMIKDQMRMEMQKEIDDVKRQMAEQQAMMQSTFSQIMAKNLKLEQESMAQKAQIAGLEVEAKASQSSSAKDAGATKTCRSPEELQPPQNCTPPTTPPHSAQKSNKARRTSRSSRRFSLLSGVGSVGMGRSGEKRQSRANGLKADAVQDLPSQRKWWGEQRKFLLDELYPDGSPPFRKPVKSRVSLGGDASVSTPASQKNLDARFEQAREPTIAEGTSSAEGTPTSPAEVEANKEKFRSMDTKMRLPNKVSKKSPPR
eukprot:gnl/TRDRNA2_/TRDRNA2_81310_c0_seq1.p1 gnl/TRDRNA2_/TRDRNA2_81310_c0~~gnl/TRDRNA2_/TRDRNA2_81310_c0_seq1.p1  ORF type:complete len:1197 (+),score=330.67 gnl/TRDRNA2_/TRDRNA2_81310_c0_seq1:378-3593(+)